jgi:hypothetical protein
MELHDDVKVTIVGFLLLNDELPHSSTTTWLLEREVHRVKIIMFVWLKEFLV